MDYLVYVLLLAVTSRGGLHTFYP